jgi:hypothetical protein
MLMAMRASSRVSQIGKLPERGRSGAIDHCRPRNIAP